MDQRTIDMWREQGVVIAGDVDPLRIAETAIIHPGCRISGSETSIGPGCVLGAEAPATLEDCQLGRNVELKGGCFSGATFFDGSSMGSCAHVRAGTILEEEANGAHAVGLKQTILLPFTTLGSLINFCDILMAGGTSRKNHSEVGSSYTHFNFTPHQDKATASLIGDIPNGVFLDRPPIFLGGQGGVVGPARIAYGSVVAAGGICRQDIIEENQLHVPVAPAPTTRPYDAGVYHDIDRLVKNNLVYIGNILALRAWYRNVRRRFMNRDTFDKACLEGGLKNLDLVLEERIKRLGELAGKMEYSFQALESRPDVPVDTVAAQKRFHSAWPEIMANLERPDLQQDSDALENFKNSLPSEGSYLEAIKPGQPKEAGLRIWSKDQGEERFLDPAIREMGRAWLQSIVDGVNRF